ncbi:MAG: hypothetical protein Q8L96_11505 [Hylemonella sp.]|nr:hypothetical protein [Hylemonella sp.]
MTAPEPPPLPDSPPQSAEALAWLDGVAGREVACDASRDGARLREALLDTRVEGPAPPWAQIERLAASAPAPLRPPAAANQSHFRARYGWAAAIAICSVLLVSQWPYGRDDAPQLRGAGATEATWRVAAPADAAKALADELRGLGANVTHEQDPSGVRLNIVAPRPAVAAVNHRLQTLETGLDVNGQLMLRILPLER